MKILMIVLMFFFISGLLIISNNNLTMCKPENVEKFSELYTQWINQVYLNAQWLTGEVVKLSWLPE